MQILPLKPCLFRKLFRYQALALPVFVLCLLGVSVPAHSQDMMIAAIDFGPFSFREKSGELNGIGVDILKEIGKRTGLRLRDGFIVTSQLNTHTLKEIAAYPLVFRTPDREAIFRWVGKVTDDNFCFLTLTSAKTVSTVEEARTLNAIGVNEGGSSEKAFDATGLKNKVGAVGNSGNVRKLFANKVDAWFSTKHVAAFSVKLEGFDPKKTVCSGDLGKVAIWVAASSKLDEASFKKLQASFQQLETEGFIKKTLEKYN